MRDGQLDRRSTLRTCLTDGFRDETFYLLHGLHLHLITQYTYQFQPLP